MNDAPLFAITGASGGGKSTLLAELQFLGHSIVPEAGRAVVREQIARGGRAVPWLDRRAFIEEVLARNIRDHAAATAMKAPVFFDRGAPEVRLFGYSTLPAYRAAIERCRYNTRVFVTEPWPEIYVTDTERRQTFETSILWYTHSIAAYTEAGYELCFVPKGTVRERAEFILANATAGR